MGVMRSESVLDAPALGKVYVLDVREAAAILRVHPDTVYKWCRRGAIPSRKIGGRVLVPRVELLLFLSGRRGSDHRS